jgi:chromosome segregation ATPase
MIGPETSISIALLISIASIVSTVINTVAGGQKRAKEEIDRDNARQMDIEKNFVKINVKLDEFCNTSHELMTENGKKTDDLKRVSEQLVAVSEQIKTLYRFHEDHENRIKALENKP